MAEGEARASSDAGHRHPSAGDAVFHHDLCFGCGQANLFGLQLELAPTAQGGVEGRFFVKQDHQGPPGYAHGGVIGAALDEAMALVLHHEGTYALTARLVIELREPVPIGTFLQLVARIEERGERRVRLSAEAVGLDGGLAARAEGLFVRPDGARAGGARPGAAPPRPNLDN